MNDQVIRNERHHMNARHDRSVSTWTRLLRFSAVATLFLVTWPVLANQLVFGESNMKSLFEFDDAEEKRGWIIVNDGVMGGVSSSSFTVDEDSTAEFAGTVSLENYGGFASVRTHPQDFELDEYSGISIRVRGDGKRYQFRLRAGEEFDGIAYRMDFETESDTWQEINLPFDRFVATFRGQILKDVEALEPDRIRQIGFLIAEKQAGEFSLKIDWIRAYR